MPLFRFFVPSCRYLHPRSGFWGPLFRFLCPRSGYGGGFQGTSAKTTLLETTLLRTSEKTSSDVCLSFEPIPALLPDQEHDPDSENNSHIMRSARVTFLAGKCPSFPVNFGLQFGSRRPKTESYPQTRNYCLN